MNRQRSAGTARSAMRAAPCASTTSRSSSISHSSSASWRLSVLTLDHEASRQPGEQRAQRGHLEQLRGLVQRRLVQQRLVAVVQSEDLGAPAAVPAVHRRSPRSIAGPLRRTGDSSTKAPTIATTSAASSERRNSARARGSRPVLASGPTHRRSRPVRDRGVRARSSRQMLSPAWVNRRSRLATPSRRRCPRSQCLWPPCLCLCRWP